MPIKTRLFVRKTTKITQVVNNSKLLAWHSKWDWKINEAIEFQSNKMFIYEIKEAVELEYNWKIFFLLHQLYVKVQCNLSSMVTYNKVISINSTVATVIPKKLNR